MYRMAIFIICAFVMGLLMASASHAENDGQVVIHLQDRAPAKALEKNFTGKASIEAAFDTKPPQRVYGAYVTFEPGARTNWHTHPLGQTLIVTSGTGLTQEWGRPIKIINAGDVVLCPPKTKHWHGASPDKAMTHLAIGERAENKNVTWLEPVSDKEYLQR